MQRMLQAPCYPRSLLESPELRMEREAELLLAPYELAPRDVLEAKRQYVERCSAPGSGGESVMGMILYGLECENVLRRRLGSDD